MRLRKIQARGIERKGVCCTAIKYTYCAKSKLGLRGNRILICNCSNQNFPSDHPIGAYFFMPLQMTKSLFHEFTLAHVKTCSVQGYTFVRIR
jgi:hypothetical protein